jgi:hypothetical protein
MDFFLVGFLDTLTVAKVLWLVDHSLENDREISSCTTAVARQ